MVYTHNGVWLSHTDQWNNGIWWKIDETGEHDSLWNKSVSGSQGSNISPLMWMLDEIMRKGRIQWK